MTYCTDDTFHVAKRRTHRCSWCGETIKLGERYARYRYFDGADAGTVKMHEECHADMLECAASEPGPFEFGFGEAPRPEKL